MPHPLFDLKMAFGKRTQSRLNRIIHFEKEDCLNDAKILSVFAGN
jgi:hypothetical protein